MSEGKPLHQETNRTRAEKQQGLEVYIRNSRKKKKKKKGYQTKECRPEKE
jgi:hypothetical protein